MRQEVRLAGFGGQGIIMAGYILGKAAGLYGGDQQAVFTQSYGPEARGGACAAQGPPCPHPTARQGCARPSPPSASGGLTLASGPFPREIPSA